jgi:WD40-like Beta Propeller Repeat
MRQALVGLFAVVSLVPVSGAGGTAAPAIGGKAVTVATARGRTIGWLVVSSLSGKDKRPLTKPLGGAERRSDYIPTWSPDGSQVAFARWTPKQVALMVVKDDGTGLHRVAVIGHKGWVNRILWSPDGVRLSYFVSNAAIYVASAAGSGQKRIAVQPRKPYGFLSLFGWTVDGRRVTYAFSQGEHFPSRYEGPADLTTASSDGSEREKIVSEDAITDASWLPDGSLVYVRHCLAIACQLAVLSPTRRRARPLTHFKPWPDWAGVGWDYLPLARRPHSGDIVYTHARKVYEVSPSTGKTRTVASPRCPRRRCWSPEEWIDLAGITPDGRFAVIEYVNEGEGDQSTISRAYRLELDTGALTRIHLVTANPAQIYLG